MIASIIFGVLLAAVGVWFMVHGTPLQRRGARTTGRVVGLQRDPRSVDADGVGIQSYSPVLEFRTASGEQVQVVARSGGNPAPARRGRCARPLRSRRPERRGYRHFPWGMAVPAGRTRWRRLHSGPDHPGDQAQVEQGIVNLSLTATPQIAWSTISIARHIASAMSSGLISPELKTRSEGISGIRDRKRS